MALIIRAIPHRSTSAFLYPVEATALNRSLHLYSSAVRADRALLPRFTPHLVIIRSMTNRPSRSQAPPPPSTNSSFCLDCGRVMPAPLADTTTPRKYCSASCRSRSKDRSRIDDRKRLIEAFKLQMVQKGAKGVVLCSEVESEAAASSGAEAESKEAEEVKAKHQDGREEARRAARRLVNFGWRSQGVEEDREVDAVQGGKIVEASFAKGEWGIRWADK